MRRLLVISFALAALAASCPAALLDFISESSEVEGRVRDSISMPVSQPSSAVVSASAPFSFLVLGDPHFGASFAADKSTLDSFSALAGSKDRNGKPYAFVLSVGDDAHDGSGSELDAFASWASTWKDAEGSPMRWYSAIGNHDLYHGGWSRFRERIGPSCFRLAAGGFSIYVVDSGQGTLGEYQIERLRKEFDSDPMPKIVVSHYAVYAGAEVLYYYRLSNPREIAELLDLFARSDVRLIIAGHWHYFVRESIGSMEEWLVDSLTVTDGGSSHCLAVTIDGNTASVARLSF